MDYGALARTLAYIRRHRIEQGQPPTVREIAKGVGCSVSIAHERVRVLARHGWVTTAGAGWNLRPVPRIDEQVVRFTDVREVLSVMDVPPSTIDQITKRLIGLAILEQDAAHSRSKQ